jgi:hypothetical protein
VEVDGVGLEGGVDDPVSLVPVLVVPVLLGVVLSLAGLDELADRLVTPLVSRALRS